MSELPSASLFICENQFELTAFMAIIGETELIFGEIANVPVNGSARSAAILEVGLPPPRLPIPKPFLTTKDTEKMQRQVNRQVAKRLYQPLK